MRKLRKLCFELRRYLYRKMYSVFESHLEKLPLPEQINHLLKAVNINHFEEIRLNYIENNIIAIDDNIVGSISLLMAINANLKSGESITILYREAVLQRTHIVSFLTDGSADTVNVAKAISEYKNQITEFVQVQSTIDSNDAAHRHNARMITELNKHLVKSLHSLLKLTLHAPTRG